MAGLNVDGWASERVADVRGQAADVSGRAADGVLVGSAGVPLTSTLLVLPLLLFVKLV